MKNHFDRVIDLDRHLSLDAFKSILLDCSFGGFGLRVVPEIIECFSLELRIVNFLTMVDS